MQAVQGVQPNQQPPPVLPISTAAPAITNPPLLFATQNAAGTPGPPPLANQSPAVNPVVPTATALSPPDPLTQQGLLLPPPSAPAADTPTVAGIAGDPVGSAVSSSVGSQATNGPLDSSQDGAGGIGTGGNASATGTDQAGPPAAEPSADLQRAGGPLGGPALGPEPFWGLLPPGALLPDQAPGEHLSSAQRPMLSLPQVCSGMLKMLSCFVGQSDISQPRSCMLCILPAFVEVMKPCEQRRARSAWLGWPV